MILPEHRTLASRGDLLSNNYFPGRPGLSQSLYDALRIATWAVLIVGVVLLVVGIINYARR